MQFTFLYSSSSISYDVSGSKFSTIRSTTEKKCIQQNFFPKDYF